MKKFFQIANGIALIDEVSDKYQNLFTPAGYAFSIWILIYIGLILFVIYQGRSLFRKVKQDEFVLQIGWWFVVSCAANCLWVLAWLYDFTGFSVLLMMLLLFSLIKIILNTNMELDDARTDKAAFLWWPFSFYSGWISVALIANVAAYLTKIKWDGFGISDLSWTIIMICLAGVINIFVTWNRNMREFGFIGVWGLIAVAVANLNGARSIVIAAIAVSALIFISSSVHAYKNRKMYPWRER